MIKIAVVALGRNLYSAFSLNQECPLATTFRGKGKETRREIERILTVRFHAQRSEYKKLNLYVPRITTHNNWKYIWTDTSVMWNKLEPQMKLETILDEVGVKIERAVDNKAGTTYITEPMYVAEATEDGKCSFTPFTKDIIAESEIPAYIKEHQKGNK